MVFSDIAQLYSAPSEATITFIVDWLFLAESWAIFVTFKENVVFIVIVIGGSKSPRSLEPSAPIKFHDCAVLGSIQVAFTSSKFLDNSAK